MATPDNTEICATIADNVIHLLASFYIADRHGCHICIGADALGEWHLEHCCIGWTFIGDHTAGNIHGIGPGGIEHLGDLKGIFDFMAAFFPVDGGYPDDDRPILGPGFTHFCKYLEW